jgi:hypothetical protein
MTDLIQEQQKTLQKEKVCFIVIVWAFIHSNFYGIYERNISRNVNYIIESDKNKTIAHLSIKVKLLKCFLSQFSKSTCLRTFNSIFFSYKRKIEQNQCMNEQSFPFLFITIWCIPSCFFARTICYWLLSLSY